VTHPAATTRGTVAGLPFVRRGSGTPTISLPGVGPGRRVPSTGDRALLRLETAPLVREVELWTLGRRRGLPKGTTMRDLAADRRGHRAVG
jgi:hypothetical protein